MPEGRGARGSTRLACCGPTRKSVTMSRESLPQRAVGGSRGSSSRFFAWVHSRRGALTLERLGLPACLAIAYLHPTMLWINELPIHVRLFGEIGRASCRE